MNGQYQETPGARKPIPEERKQDIMVLLARMIQQRLTATDNSKETTTGKGLEPRMNLRHDSRIPERAAHFESL